MKHNDSNMIMEKWSLISYLNQAVYGAENSTYNNTNIDALLSVVTHMTHLRDLYYYHQHYDSSYCEYFDNNKLVIKYFVAIVLISTDMDNTIAEKEIFDKSDEFINIIQNKLPELINNVIDSNLKFVMNCANEDIHLIDTLLNKLYHIIINII